MLPVKNQMLIKTRSRNVLPQDQGRSVHRHLRILVRPVRHFDIYALGIRHAALQHFLLLTQLAHLFFLPLQYFLEL